MIKILSDLKQSDKAMYNRVEKELERYGATDKKAHYNRLNYPDYLDLISFSDTYSFQPDQFQYVIDVLSDLNPTENECMKLVKSVTPENTANLKHQINVANNRTRQRVVKLVEKYTAKTGKSFIENLSNLKNAVFS